MKDWVKILLIIIGLIILIAIGVQMDDDYSVCDPYGTGDHGCRAQERARGR